MTHRHVLTIVLVCFLSAFASTVIGGGMFAQLALMLFVFSGVMFVLVGTLPFAIARVATGGLLLSLGLQFILPFIAFGYAHW